jgi:hypothetical protein
MNQIIGFLFPWRQTFRRLELKKHWWHRLAIVLFFVALVPMLLYSWVIGIDVNQPTNSFEDDIHHWGAALSGSPTGVLVDRDSQSFDGTRSSTKVFDTPVIQKTIQMPNGKTATFPGNVSDEAIKTEWQSRLETAKNKAPLYGLGVALLATVVFSYLLQTAYRLALYVIYGANAGAQA